MNNMMNIKKPLGLNLNREQAALLLKGLEGISGLDRQNVLYEKLKRDLETIIVIWDRRIKNEKILSEQRRLTYAKKRTVKS